MIVCQEMMPCQNTFSDLLSLSVVLAVTPHTHTHKQYLPVQVGDTCFKDWSEAPGNGVRRLYKHYSSADTVTEFSSKNRPYALIHT